MGHHIDPDGRFQSDKYPELKPDQILVSFRNPSSWRSLWILAEDYQDVDAGLSQDIRDRLLALGYQHDIILV